MTATVTRGSLGQFQTIVLENRYLRAVIIPELGGRVWELEDRVRGRQWLWHRDDVALAEWPVGTAYDDAWAGGWEELFPNDAPCQFEGRALPDHGEWWATRWRVAHSTEGRTATVRLSATLSVIRASCTKEFHLPEDAAVLSVRYRIRSEEARPFHFLFKQHLPLRITPHCRLSLPGGKASSVDPSFGTLVPTSESFDWPIASRDGGTADLRVIPAASSQAREFLYVRDLAQPWCGVEDRENDAALRMTFDSQLPFVWLFLSYGGWRNAYTAVLEPCSNMPKDLAEATRVAQAAQLAPGSEFDTSVSVSLSACDELQR